MPTEDQFVTVPLNSGLNLKTDEFTTTAPKLRKSDNVNNAGEVGSANFLPRILDLADSGVDQGQRALVPGNDVLCMIRKNSQAAIYNKATNTWDDTRVVTGVTSADIAGRFIITATRPVSGIAHGTTDTYEVFAWLEQGFDGTDGGVGRYVVRSGEANLGPFEIPFQGNTIARFHAIAMTRGTTETYLYVAEEEVTLAQTKIVGYRIDADGTATQVFTVGATAPVDLDVVEDPGVDPNKRHYLASNENTAFKVRLITVGGSTDAETIQATGMVGLGVAIDFDGTNVVAVAVGGGSPSLASVHFDPTDFAGTNVKDTNIFLSDEASRVTLRACRDGFLGIVSNRKGVNGRDVDREEVMSPFQVTGAGAIDVLNGGFIECMRVVGDGMVDEDGGFIVPCAFTKPNTLDPVETDITRATWPVDPAIVGYLFTLQPFKSTDEFALHPVARWGVDRVRSEWSRSKASMPYAADPTTPDQVYGRSILDVTVVQRKTGAHEVLSNGSALFASSIAHIFDGNNFIPAGHLWRPEFGDTFTAANGTTPAGTYNYKAVFIWEDDTGLLIRSADSSAAEVVVSNNEKVRLLVKFHRPPAGDDTTTHPLRCWFYATVDGGSLYYLLTDDAGNPAETFLNTTSDHFDITITNGAGDPSNPLLTFAAVPPEIAPQCPSGFHDVASAHNRVWGIDAEDRNRVWFSKIMGRFEPPEFNSVLTLDFAEEDGDLVALGVVNGNPVFFKQHTLWALQGGEGPSNVVGFGRGYARPVKIGHMGTTNRRSVVSFPGGVVFHNGQSLMLLDAGYQVQPFGLEIQPATLGGVIDSAHITGRRELHFNIDDLEGGFRHFVYNYDVDLWGEWPDTNFSFIDEMVTVNSRIFLLDGDLGESLQIKESVADGIGGFEPDGDLGVVRPIPDMVIKTAFIRPGDRNAARRVREIILEFNKSEAPASGSLGVVIDEEQGLGGKSLSWTAAEIAAAYPNANAQRVILRIVPEEQLESVSVELTIPVTLNLKPVSCSVLFGIEEGVQRRYPEGSTK